MPAAIDPFRISHEEIIKRVVASHGDEITIVGKAKGISKKARWQCNRGLGHPDWYAQPNFVIDSKYACPACAGKQLLTEDEIQLRVRKKHGNRISLIGGTHGRGRATTWRCNVNPEHPDWISSPENVLGSRWACPQCGINSRASSSRLTHKEAKRQLKEKHNGTIKLREKYRGSSYRYKFECQECQHTWKARWTNVIFLGTGCPPCSVQSYSKVGVQCIEALAKKSRLKFRHALNGGEVKINGTRVDGYNRHYNIIIEFHGKYWHTLGKKTKQKSSNRTRMLRRYANVIVIWDYKWKKNPDAVMRRVLTRIATIKGRS